MYGPVPPLGVADTLPVNAPCNDHSEQRANARLIAAAPDLLEALLMMFASIHPYRDDGTPTIPDETVAKANAAIAKATGGSTR